MATPAPAVTPPTLASARDRWTGLWVVLAVAFFRSLAISLFVLVRGGYKIPQEEWTLGVAGQLGESLIVLGLLVYVLRTQHRSLADIGFRPKWLDVPVSVGIMLCAVIVAYAFRVVCWLIYLSLGRPLPPPLMGNAALYLGFSALPIALMLVNPWFEELIVRGFLMTEVSELSGRMWIAVLASAILQGAYHLYQGLPYAISLTGCFLVFSAYFAWKKNIFPIILAHMYMDLWALAAMHVPH